MGLTHHIDAFLLKDRPSVRLSTKGGLFPIFLKTTARLLAECRKADRQRTLGLATMGETREVQMSAKPRPTQCEFTADPLLLKRPTDPPAIRLADLKSDRFRSGGSSVGNLDPLALLGRLDPLVFARYLITFSIGMSVALAWQSYGGTTRELSSLKAASLDRDAVHQSLDRIVSSVATSQEQMTRRLERSIERGVDRLAAGQEQVTREINDLQTVEQYFLDRMSTPPPRPAAAAASKSILRSPPAPIQLTPATSP